MMENQDQWLLTNDMKLVVAVVVVAHHGGADLNRENLYVTVVYHLE
jgi:hypothetical protein